MKESKKESAQAALISIKPQFADKLIEGNKKYEFRRVALKPDTTHLIIYASSPVKKIIGVAEIESINTDTPTALWNKTKHAAGISRQAFRDYFQGSRQAVAIEVRRVKRFKNAIEPKVIDCCFKAPQSFFYVDNDYFEMILSKGLCGKTT